MENAIGIPVMIFSYAIRGNTCHKTRHRSLVHIYTIPVTITPTDTDSGICELTSFTSILNKKKGMLTLDSKQQIKKIQI